MKPKASYKYMDTRMLIRLAMFQIEDQLVVSCFLLEVVLLVGVVRNNQQLHYQAWRHNTEAQQLLHVK
jgi:hypothetical protein